MEDFENEQVADAVRRRRAHEPGWNGKRVIAVAVGAVLAAVSLALVGAGVFVVGKSSENGGYVPLATDSRSYHADGYALASDGWDAKNAVLGLIDTVRVQFAPSVTDTATFVGIARSDAANRYLADVAHSGVRESKPGAELVSFTGGAPSVRPDSAGIWAAKASGTGAHTLTWPVQRGDWVLVVMNADNTPHVGGRVSVSAAMPALPGIGIGAIVAGAVVFIGAVALVVITVRRARRRTT